jgi:hypothetical protein
VLTDNAITNAGGEKAVFRGLCCNTDVPYLPMRNDGDNLP